MTRGLIRGKDTSVVTDNGSLVISVVDGEQLHFDFTLEWLSDLTDYTVVAKIVESLNEAGDGRTVPMDEAVTPQIVTLPIIDTVTDDNIFTLVIPKDISDDFDVAPTPDDPVYAYFAIEVSDDGEGSAQKIWVPVRGVIEILYNPVRTV